jgi:hypothetical protein
MPTVYKATMPYFFIRLIGVLIITYIPLFFIGSQAAIRLGVKVANML